MKKNINRPVNPTASRPLRCILPYIDGVSAIQRQQIWPGSPWKAFR